MLQNWKQALVKMKGKIFFKSIFMDSEGILKYRRLYSADHILYSFGTSEITSEALCSTED